MIIKNEKSKLTLDEMDYRPIDKFKNDNFNYELKVDMANQIIDNITDNIYIISNKLESIQKIAKTLNLDINKEIENIINNIYDIFNSGNDWYKICNEFNSLE